MSELITDDDLMGIYGEILLSISEDREEVGKFMEEFYKIIEEKRNHE